MVSEINPNQTINGQEIQGCDPETTGYLRAIAELIFDAWKEQHSSSVKSGKTLVPTDKTNSST